MTIDTSREAVERLNTHRVYIDRTMCFDEGITWTTVAGIYPHAYVPEDFALALLSRAEAAEAEVARLSTPPDDAETAVLEGWLRNPWSKAAPGTERGPIPEWVYALMHQAADALTRLPHALAAEKAKRGAMEAALTGLLEPFGDDPCRYDHHGKCQEHFIEDDCCVARARATLAKHGSKT